MRCNQRVGPASRACPLIGPSLGFPKEGPSVHAITFAASIVATFVSQRLRDNLESKIDVLRFAQPSARLSCEPNKLAAVTHGGLHFENAVQHNHFCRPHHQIY